MWVGRIIVATGVALLLPASAVASTVSVQPAGENNEVFYEAGPGEQNRLKVSSDGAAVTVRDPGAEVEVGPGCASVTDHRATCNLPGFGTVNAELRGGADSVRANGAMTILDAEGGPGSDRLIGGPLHDRLDGGPGPDVLKGRGAPDMASYVGRSDDLRITIGDGMRNDGGPADGPLRDRLVGISFVSGGDGDDVLVGDAGENSLFGAPGRDVLRGLGGDDDLIGGDGRDRAHGGNGADLFPGSGGRDRAFGGRGPDHFQAGSPGNGADLFAGGRGHDVAQFSFGHNLVTLDGKANDGPCADPGCTFSDEGDNVKGIEELQMAPGNDVLIGSKRDEVFRPSGGADIVRAKGGDDTIHVTIDGDPDVYNCGPGIDEIIGTPDVFDTNPNCE